MGAIPQQPSADASLGRGERISTAQLSATIVAFFLLPFFILRRENPPRSTQEARAQQQSAARRAAVAEALKKKALEHQRQLLVLNETCPVQTYKAAMAAEPEPLNNNCVICIEDFEPEDEVRLLTCRHIHHSDCLKLWLSWSHYCCPTCRKPFEAADARPKDCLNAAELGSLQSSSEASESALS